MRRIVPAASFVLLGAGLVVSGRVEPPRAVEKPQPAAAQHAIDLGEDWNFDLDRPVPLRLTVPPAEGYGQGNATPFAAAEERDSRPLSRLKLFDSGGVAAEWRYDGQVQYRLKGLNPFGANVGGRVSSNSARLTFSWQTSD